MKKNQFLIGLWVALAMTSMPAQMLAQVNTGSSGSDGALDFSAYANLGTNIVINMADHPNGIYQYTYINIPSGATVTFTPNANNSALTWLVQSNVNINGTVDISGKSGDGQQYQGDARGGIGGPGGWAGGNGGVSLTSGQGPGGGVAFGSRGGNASYATLGSTNSNGNPPGAIYGNPYLIPLIGGSGGSGATDYSGVGGGGGAGVILIAASGNVFVNGPILARGGGSGTGSPNCGSPGGGGSGGGVRIVASKISGTGQILTDGGSGSDPNCNGRAGSGWVRFDTYENDYSGGISGVFTQGSQFIIIPSAGQLPQLTVSSIGGVPVSASPTGVLSTPDAVLSAQQNNPIPIVVSCSNLPLNTQITVSVKPANGPAVSATGYNNTGTLLSSTASLSMAIPRGGGLIYASATSN